MKNNESNQKKLILDHEGFEKFKQDIESVEKKLNDVRMYKGNVAIFQGDNWHDNPALYQTESEERSLMKTLRDMRAQLENVEIVERDTNSDVIQLGDVLRLNMIFSEDDTEEMIVKLVGRVGSGSIKEAEVMEVSVESPLGNAVYQKRVSDCVSYKVESREFNLEILEKLDLTKATETEVKKTKTR